MRLPKGVESGENLRSGGEFGKGGSGGIAPRLRFQAYPHPDWSGRLRYRDWLLAFHGPSSRIPQWSSSRNPVGPWRARLEGDSP